VTVPTLPPIPSWEFPTRSRAEFAASFAPEKTITLVWDNPDQDFGAWVVEIHHSRDLSLDYEDWPILTNSPYGSSNVVILATNAYDFFIARYRNESGLLSDWSRRE
jgi:hypothetical protein